MKISASIRDLHSSLKQQAELLKTYVDDIISPYCQANDFDYHSRIKSLESFAEKIELGRTEINDFFGATVVVPQYNQIKLVKEYLNNDFELLEIKPNSAKRPQDFDFDSYRYYYKLKDSLSTQKLEYKDFKFEIQIVTLLEKAWSKIFHNYSYKTNDINWTKERLSYQIKTLLKNADMMIHEADSLSESSYIKDNCDNYDALKKIKNILQKYWEPDFLSNNNMKRQCEALYNIVKVTQITIEELDNLINQETLRGKGAKLLNLSPYSSIIQALLDTQNKKFLDNTKKINKHLPFILIIDEIELPLFFDIKKHKALKKISDLKNLTQHHKENH